MTRAGQRHRSPSGRNILHRPSRHIPGVVRLGLFFGDKNTHVGWLLVGLGLCFVWGSGGSALLHEWALHRHGGNIHNDARVEVTNGLSGHSAADGKAVTECAPPGAARTEPQVFWTARRKLFAVALIPVVGVLSMLRGMIKALKGGYLLAHGTLTTGSLISRTPTLEMERRNGERIYKFAFAFVADDGKTYSVSARAPRSERPDGQIVYNVRNPHTAVLLDDLSGRPRIGERDEIRRQHPAWLIVFPLVIPTVTVVGHTYWALHVCEIV